MYFIIEHSQDTIKCFSKAEDGTFYVSEEIESNLNESFKTLTVVHFVCFAL